MNIDISHIRFQKNAQVYQIITPLSNHKIEKLFKECSKNKRSNFLINDINKTFQVDSLSITYSVIVFTIKNQPSFLINTNKEETKYALLLMIEHDGYLFIFKNHIDSLDNKLNPRNIQQIDYQKFTNFKASSDTKYEKIAMNSMTISNTSIRNRSFEGRNLNGILPSNSASRSIANNFRLNNNGEVYTITPSTSRLSYRSHKSGIEDLSRWCISVTQELKLAILSNSFIKNFASPISLRKIKSSCKPTAILFSFEELDSQIRESNSDIKLIIFENGTEVVLEGFELDIFFELFKTPLNLVFEKTDLFSVIFKGQKGLAKIKLNKNTISVKSKIGKNILIESPTEKITLIQYINNYKNFSVVFDKPTYMYFSKHTFEDKQLLNNIEGMMSIFDDSYDFSKVKSEKEKPHDPTFLEFPKESLFYSIENNLGKNDEIIICDDMGNEWADHIVISTKSALPTISYIHSKYSKKETYGASSFHEVVSQALKNLGKVNSEIKDYKNKYDNKWENKYESTSIKRVRTNNSWQEIEDALNNLNSNPNSIRKVILATPFFSKSSLKLKLEKIASGKSTNSHHIQIIWLINSFISTCRHYNIQPYIYCKK